MYLLCYEALTWLEKEIGENFSYFFKNPSKVAED